MENEKLREIKLSRATKYTLLSTLLIGLFTFGAVSLLKEPEVNSEIVNSDEVLTPDDTEDQESGKQEEIVVVEDEKLIKPYTVNAQIKTYFYDLNDEENIREKALVYYNGSYTPSVGVDYFYNNMDFDVIAVFDGEVSYKKVDPLYGVTVAISNNNGLVAVYSSLSSVNVEVGDKVEQGKIIAKAGTNTINSNLGNHLNFSLLKNENHINPLVNFSKKIKDI